MTIEALSSGPMAMAGSARGQGPGAMGASTVVTVRDRFIASNDTGADFDLCETT